MASARERARQLWDARDVARLEPTSTLVHRTLELMDRHRLATFNGRDFQIFTFLKIVKP